MRIEHKISCYICNSENAPIKITEGYISYYLCMKCLGESSYFKDVYKQVLDKTMKGYNIVIKNGKLESTKELSFTKIIIYSLWFYILFSCLFWFWYFFFLLII